MSIICYTIINKINIFINNEKEGLWIYWHFTSWDREKIARRGTYLNDLKHGEWLTYDDNEKDKKINKDFKEFEKLGVDDDIDEISLKNNVKNSLNELNDLMATFNVDKKKIIDT